MKRALKEKEKKKKCRRKKGKCEGPSTEIAEERQAGGRKREANRRIGRRRRWEPKVVEGKRGVKPFLSGQRR